MPMTEAIIRDGSIQAARNGNKVYIVMTASDEYNAMMIYDTIAMAIDGGGDISISLAGKKEAR
jgi:hypothetical protein